MKKAFQRRRLKVDAQAVAGNSQQSVEADGSSSSFLIDGLRPGRLYNVAVTPVYRDGSVGRPFTSVFRTLAGPSSH